MKKNIVISIIIIVCLSFMPTILAIDLDVDDAGGSGSGVDNSCETSLSSNKICRSGTDKFNFYVSRTNDASASNGIMVLQNKTISEINSYYDKITASKASVCQFLASVFGISCEDLDLDCSSFQNEIYFAIEAPFYYKKQHVRNVTVKELARRCTNGTYDCKSTNASAISNYFRTTNNRANVYSTTTGPTSDWNQIANISSGWGVAAISLKSYGISCDSKPIVGCKPGYEVKISGQGPTCRDDNSNHNGTISEYTVFKCNGTAGRYGRFTSQMGTYCKMYCLESANESFPGGISTGISLGTSLVWPTSNNNGSTIWGNQFPLKLNGKRTCRIQVLRNDDKPEEIVPYADYLSTKKQMDANTMAHGVYTNMPPSVGCSRFQNEINNAQNAYNRCHVPHWVEKCDSKKNPITGKWESHNCRQVQEYPDCSAEQRAVEIATDKNNTCINYGRAYTAAQNILKDMKQCVEWNLNPNQIYNFQSNINMSYNDPEYGTTYNLEKESDTNYSCTNCNSSNSLNIDPTKVNLDAFANAIKNTENRVVTANANVNYKLPDGLYHYVNKKTNKSMMNPTGDYITIGHSNLPTSYDAKLGHKYELKLNVISLGHSGNLTKNAGNEYKCHYTVTNTITDECVCPEGTKNAGKDLYCEIYNAGNTSNTITCADAQVLYCDSTDNLEEVCTDEKFCPNDRSIKITACLNNGYSYNYCVSNLCSNGSNYHCPSGTFNDGMDIKPCVFANIGMGLQNAINFCQKTVCPYKGGINIIYRPISLRNPFPGKTATGKTIDFNLDKINGRYPGTNWNSKTLVKNQILYNRKTEANNIYTKEPLYTFILDSGTIKNIRKYNDNQEKYGGYADYTLKCGDNGISCLSNQFLRESDSGLSGGRCIKTSHNKLYECYES